MFYQPNLYDAEAVYVLAAQSLYTGDGDVTVDEPSTNAIEPIGAGQWRINALDERNPEAPAGEPLALCMYSTTAGRWTVKLAGDEVTVQPVWSDDESNWVFLLA